MTKDGRQQHMPRTLADLRKAAKLTQDEVAAQMGVHRTRVGHIEARYPNVRYEALLDYIRAIGGQLRITGPVDISVDQLISDPALARTRAYLDENSKKGRERQNPTNIKRWSGTTEELPLEQGETDTGSDDTSRKVDQPDTESDQTDRENSQ